MNRIALIIIICVGIANYGISQPCVQSIGSIIEEAMVLKETNLDKGRELAQLAYNLALSCNDSVLNEALILNGFCRYSSSQYDTVISIVKQALPKAQERNDWLQASKSAELLFLVYKKLKDNKIASKYADEAVSYAIRSADSLQWLLMLSNKANLLATERIEDAIVEYKYILSFARKSPKFSKVFDNSQHNLATLYSMNWDYDEAILIYDTMLSRAQSSPFADLSLLHYNRGLCNFYRGQELEGIEEVKQAISIIEPEQLSQKADYLETLSYLYDEFGQPDSALNSMREAYSLRQAFYTKNNAEEVSRLREQLEAEQREMEIDQLYSDKEIESYQKRLFVGLSIALAIILALSIVLYRNRMGNQRAIANEKINQLEKEKEVLSLQTMLFAQEEERQRIARDLHDSIGALLSTAKLHMSNIEEELKALTNIKVLKSAKEIIENASTEVRRVAHNMMPGVLMKLGLEEGLEEFFDKVRDNQKMQVSFVYDELPARLENKTEIMLYRMIQEMTNNTVKHAKASEIKVMLKVDADMLTLDFKDDGVGFDVENFEDPSNFGLSSLKSRAKFIGASIQLNSSKEQGTHFVVKLKLS